MAPLSNPLPPEAAALLQVTGCMDAATGRAMAQQAWALEEIGDAYQRFVALFEPVERWVQVGRNVSGIEAMVARTLLIHEYRRVVLRDPLLPSALLPEDWPGFTARALCRGMYLALLPMSEAWLDEHGRNEDGPLPPPATDLQHRFGATAPDTAAARSNRKHVTGKS